MPANHLLSSCLIALAVVFSVADIAAAQQAPIDVKKDARFNAVAWVQNSAEYKLLTEQTYRMAMSQLYVGVHDRKWSADEIQVAQGGFEDKKPAIILDVDETVLDNSAFNARNVARGIDYSSEAWNAWCNEEKADVIPGSLEFVLAAQGLGVEVFFITNRRDEVKPATINNLKRLGFPADEDHVLTQNSKDNRDGRKKTRRAMVAKDHRIVLLIGDNMSDMCLDLDVRDNKQRNAIARKKTDLLGSRWIMIPNPVYGQWERALAEGADALNTKLDVKPIIQPGETNR